MINSNRRRFAQASSLLAWSPLAALTIKSAPAQAQTPALPDAAEIIVGFPPGGAPDIVSRRLADALRGKLAQSVVVENRPGASGKIAVDAAKLAPADGLTLLLNPAGVLTVNPHTYRSLSYKPFEDLTPLSLACLIDFGFAVGPAVPDSVKTLDEFAAWAKLPANSGKVTYGSPAAGAPPHFVGDVLSRTLGLGMTHVPYRGSQPAMTDLLAGQISSLCVTLGDLVANAKAGKLRILASSGPARSRFAPNVATFTELGVKGLDLRDWFGVYIAGKPSADVAAKVAPLVAAAMSSPEMAQQLAVASLEAASSTPQELDRMARSDFERWAPIIKASGFQAEN